MGFDLFFFFSKILLSLSEVGKTILFQFPIKYCEVNT